MDLVWAIVLIVVNLAWLALVLIGLPGNWLMVGSTVLVSWLVGDFTADAPERMFSRWLLILVVALAVIGEICELLAGAVGTARAGGTKRGAIGALIGTVIGGVAGTFLLPMPVVGSLAGACAGAAVGAILFELHGGVHWPAAAKSGLGAGVGRFTGTVMKLGAGAAIWIVVAVAGFWP